MNSTVLFISPDYASHYYPMSAIGAVLAKRGNRVVFATGPTLKDNVLADGFEHIMLQLGPGSNGGIVDTGSLEAAEAAQLEQFFTASRVGMVETLRHQAENRRNDLLHEPARVAGDIASILSEVAPDSVVADHLAFGATAALRGLDQDYFGFLPGHPSAIPTKEPYGLPPQVPIRIRFDESEIEQLRLLCTQVSQDFTAKYNQAIASIDSDAAVVDNAFSAVSPHGTLVNYPASLGISYGLPLSVRFIGSSVRRSHLTPALTESFREHRSRPRIYVSFGTFFSARSDLLRKIVTAFRNEPVEMVIARGATDLDELGNIPSHWTVAERLPQPAVIARSSLVITHGGNNTVTEALTAGVPLLVGPLSTDQFAAAADIEKAGLGRSFDPNHDDVDTIADLAHDVLTRSAGPAVAIGQLLQARRGQDIAADYLEDFLPLAQRAS